MQRPKARRPVIGASGGHPLLYMDVLNFQALFFDGDILEKRAPGYVQTWVLTCIWIPLSDVHLIPYWIHDYFFMNSVRRQNSGDIWQDITSCRDNVRIFMREAKAAGWKVWFTIFDFVPLLAFFICC